MFVVYDADWHSLPTQAPNDSQALIIASDHNRAYGGAGGGMLVVVIRFELR
jgi:hypothetical protein